MTLRHKIKLALLILYPTMKFNELSVLSYLISSGEPMGARSIAFNTYIARSKIYTYINNLLSTGLIKTIEKKLSDFEVPEIWEYWSEPRRKRWKTEQKLNLVMWTPRIEPLFEKIEDYEKDLVLVRELRQYLVSAGAGDL